MKLKLKKPSFYLLILLILIQNFSFAGSVLDFIPGETGSKKFQNGLIFLVIAYNTFEVALRRVKKYHKAKQNNGPSDNSNLSNLNNNLDNSDNDSDFDENPVGELVDNMLQDFGIVTQEKLSEYLDQLLLSKYPYLSKEELTKLISNLVDKKLTEIKIS